jgi:hypothetical protein
MSIYQRDPNRKPDTEFEGGELRHLVVGNRGRLLDPRRTPVQIVDLDGRTGQFVVEITAFEDEGARWVVPFEGVDRYQFEKGCLPAGEEEVMRFRQTATRFDRPLVIAPDPGAREATERRVRELREAAGQWLTRKSRFLAAGADLPSPETREGHPLLFEDLRAYMEEQDLWEMEDGFATQFVSNPYSGERVKGHCLVLAELGLAPFDWTVVRDPDLFAGRWSKERRRQHVLSRLAFVRELLTRCGLEVVLLYRGYYDDGGGAPRKTPTFTSASFSREVSASLAHADVPDAKPVLMTQETPVSRLFMTYLETVQMNRQFKEAEAVLLYDPDSPGF